MLTEDAFKQRVQDLREREFFRQDLVAHLLEYNTKLQAGEATIQNVKALEDEDTYVVIAGQQAGLLTYFIRFIKLFQFYSLRRKRKKV